MKKTANKKARSTIFIIFGGTGDLAKRKIMPALYNLFLDGWLPANFAIIGTSSTKMTDKKYKDELLASINEFSRKGKSNKEDYLIVKNLNYLKCLKQGIIREISCQNIFQYLRLL